MAFVSSSYASSTGASVDGTLPASVQDNDILIALVQADGTPSNTASGWDFQGLTTHYALFTKIASSETGPYTFTQSGSTWMQVTIAAYRGGFDVGNPIDAVSNTAYAVSDTTLRAASVVAAASNSQIIFAGAADPTGVYSFLPPTNPGTFADDVDANVMTFASYEWNSSGATGNIDATISGTETDKHAFALILNPPLEADLDGATISLAGADITANVASMLDTASVDLTFGELDVLYVTLDAPIFALTVGSLSSDISAGVNGATASLAISFEMVESLDVEYERRLNNYLLTAPNSELIEHLVQILKILLTDGDQILYKLLNNRHIGDASGVWLGIIGDIVGVDKPFDELNDDEYFVFGDTYVGVPAVYDNGFADVAQTTGGQLRSLDGNYSDYYLSDADYEILIRAKAESTFAGTTIKTVVDYIYNTFGVTSYIWIDSLSDWHVELDSYLSVKKRQYLVQYAPVPAGSSITIDNWPEEA